MVKAVLLLLALAGVFLILYDRGLMVLQSKTAATFIGSGKGNGATFTGCNGCIKRVVRFREGGTFRYTLFTELSKGSVSAELLDGDKNLLMELTPEKNTGSVTVAEKKKYFLVIRFRAATGRYSLTRQ